jgi:hypothetical protein
MLREAMTTALQQPARQEPHKGASGKRTGKGAKVTFQGALERLLGVASMPRPITAIDVLDLVGSCSDDLGKELIEGIKARNYYKRLITIHSELIESGRQSFVDQFREKSAKAGFNGALQVKIREKLSSHLAQVEGPAASSLAPARANEVLEILDKPGMILCDCPSPPYGSNEMLRFIPEPKKLQRNYFSRVEVGERASEVWQQVFFRLMNIAAKGRVFCDPRVRDTLMAALGPEPIRGIVKELVDKF